MTDRPYFITAADNSIQAIQLGPLSLPGTPSTTDGIRLEAGGLLVLEGQQAIFMNGTRERGRLQFKPEYPIDQIVYCPAIKMLVAIGGSFIQWYHPSRLTLVHFYQSDHLEGACILDNGDIFTRNGLWLSAADRYEPNPDLHTSGATNKLPYERVSSLGTMVRVEQDGLNWIVHRGDLPSIIVAKLNGHQVPLSSLDRSALTDIYALNLPVEMHIQLIEAMEHVTDEMMLLKAALRLDAMSHYHEHSDRLEDLLQPMAEFIQAWRETSKLTPHYPLYLHCWQSIQQLVKQLDELSGGNNKPRPLINYWKAMSKKITELLGRIDCETIINSLLANEDPMQ